MKLAPEVRASQGPGPQQGRVLMSRLVARSPWRRENGGASDHWMVQLQFLLDSAGSLGFFFSLFWCDVFHFLDVTIPRTALFFVSLTEHEKTARLAVRITEVKPSGGVLGSHFRQSCELRAPSTGVAVPSSWVYL